MTASKPKSPEDATPAPQTPESAAPAAQTPEAVVDVVAVPSLRADGTPDQTPGYVTLVDTSEPSA